MKIKTIALALVLVLIVCTVTSCAVSEEEIVGNWISIYDGNDGNQYEHVITITRSLDFAYTIYKNGKMDSAMVGDCRTDGNKVILYYYDHKKGKLEFEMELKYKNGTLIYENITFEKVVD